MKLPAFLPCSEEAQPRAYDFAEEAGFREVRVVRREGRKRSFIFWVVGRKLG